MRKEKKAEELEWTKARITCQPYNRQYHKHTHTHTSRIKYQKKTTTTATNILWYANEFNLLDFLSSCSCNFRLFFTWDADELVNLGRNIESSYLLRMIFSFYSCLMCSSWFFSHSHFMWSLIQSMEIDWRLTRLCVIANVARETYRIEKPSN